MQPAFPTSPIWLKSTCRSQQRFFPAEWVFSVCGVIGSKLRASLSPSSVDSMISLANNQVLIAGHLPEDEDDELHVVPAEAVMESDYELSE